MSYQVLARKYRPKNFASLVGQEHVVRALTHALASGRLHHAYLFTGTRGVGKTTLSRILAKSLNCVGPDGQGSITAEPCGACEACTAIDAGRFVDYIEMDAASNRGVDEMASLLEQAIYAPSNARFKVYMIDEVHMLTNHAFNAMLKTLEEPPEHVKFILATTDPQKIPVTVLSRCLQFNLKQMPPGHIIGHLEHILGQEGIEYEAPALRLLAAGAHGSMRDALSLTDQAIAYAAGKVSLDAVQGMLGALDQSYLVRILDALTQQDGADLLAVADEMASRSLSYNGALQDLATLLHRIALAQTVPAAVPEDLPERPDILRLAGLFDADEIQLYYQIAVHGRNELGLAPDDYAGFSMTLLRMLAFRPGAAVGGGGAQGGGDVRPARPQAAPAPATAPRPAMAERQAAPGVATSQAAAQVQAGYQPEAQAASGAAASGAAASQPAAPQPAPQAAAQAAPPARPGGMSPAMAALAAARAASGARPGAPASGRPNPPAGGPAAGTAAGAAPAPGPASAAAAMPAPRASATVTPPLSGAAAIAAARAAAVSGGTAAAVLERPAPAPAPAPVQQAPADDLPPWLSSPPWEDEGSWSADAAPSSVPEMPAYMESAAAEAPQAPARPAPVQAQAEPPYPHVMTPVAELGWDGDWPTLAQALSVRGVAQQLAFQSELVRCECEGQQAVIHLRVPIDTWRTQANLDKLSASLTEHFGRKVVCQAELGTAWHTAGRAIQQARDARQQQAERTVQQDPFVQKMMREFNAVIVPGSVRPLAN